MELKKVSDELLVRHLQQGDHTAMASIYQMFARYLTALCSRYIQSDEDVKDVLQDAFIKIFSNIGAFQYRGPGSLKGWMARIVINESVSFLKRQHLQTTELKEDINRIGEEPTDVDTSQTPTDVIYRLIRELPDGYRTIFNLYVVEERSHQEIAQMLGISIGTSASQLHRAKALLARKIKEYQQLNNLPL